MRIAAFANTPAQVYFYKNILKELTRRGHQVRLLVRDYGETIVVANELELDYFVYSKSPASKIGKLLSLPYDLIMAYKILRRFKPDMIVGFGVYDAFTSFFLGADCIEFADSEPSVNPLHSLEIKLYMPFVDAVITPSSFRQNLGRKHLRIKSFKELAYLHPNYYKPNDDIFDLLGIKKGENYVLLRFNGFDAVHDSGIKGFADGDKIELVMELEKYAKVFISSESGVPNKIKDRIERIPKSRIHDALYYAMLLVADTQTMITEAALLGSPAVRCNRFVGKGDMGNFVELENDYGLIFNYNNSESALKKAVDLIQRPKLKMEWKNKRKNLLNEKIDVTAFMVWFIENWPESAKEIKKNPNIQDRFR